MSLKLVITRGFAVPGEFPSTTISVSVRGFSTGVASEVGDKTYLLGQTTTRDELEACVEFVTDKHGWAWVPNDLSARVRFYGC